MTSCVPDYSSHVRGGGAGGTGCGSKGVRGAYYDLEPLYNFSSTQFDRPWPCAPLPIPATPGLLLQVDCRGAAGGRGYDGSFIPARAPGGSGGSGGRGDGPPGRSAAGCWPPRPSVGSKGFEYGGIVPASSVGRPLPLNTGLGLNPRRWGGTELYMSGWAESRLPSLLSLPTSFPLFCRLVQLGMRCPGTLGGIEVAMGVLGTTVLFRPQQHRLTHLRRAKMMSSATMPTTIETGIATCRFCLYHA